jgi:SulP family sulfate permease
MNDKAGEKSWRSFVPIVDWLPRYQTARLRNDVVAGLIVAALAVPQSLGYAAIAGVPVQVGLYAVPTALLAYAIFGTSRQLVVGPVSTVSVLSGSLVANMGPADEAEAVAFTVALALGSGLVLIGVGLLRVGWVAEFLSKPIVTGFVLGLSLLVIVGEIPKLVGIPAPSGSVLDRIGSLLTGFIAEWDLLTTLVGAISLWVLFGLGRRFPSIPWALVLVLLAIPLSRYFELEDEGVQVVGEVPAGLPTPGLPGVDVATIGVIVTGGAALALIGLAEGLSAARLFATKGGYRIDAGQEFVAAGAANLTSGLFGGLGVAGSLSKTAAADDAGSRSQVSGLVTAAVSVIFIAVFAPTLSALPLAVLSAIVVKAVWGLMDLDALRRYREVRRLDLVAAVAAVVGVLVLGPLYGLGAAVAISVLGLVYRASQAHIDEMGRISVEKAAWGSLNDHPERLTIPGIVVLRLDSPLFWVNSLTCMDGIVAAVDRADEVRVVVLDLEGTNVLDITSADALAELAQTLHKQDVDVYLVRVRFAVRQLMRRSRVMDVIGEDHVWHSISQGVRQARKDHGITEEPRPQSDTGAPRIPKDGEDEYGHRWSPFDD